MAFELTSSVTCSKEPTTLVSSAKAVSSAAALSDPLCIADTPMVSGRWTSCGPTTMTPRVTCNPAYSRSFHPRTADAPPAITRRPGDAPYHLQWQISRLAILQEIRGARLGRSASFLPHCACSGPRAWRARNSELTGHLAGERAARWADLHRARLWVSKRREFPLSRGKRAGVAGATMAADGRRLSGTAVALSAG